MVIPMDRSSDRPGEGLARRSAQYRRRHAESESRLASLCPGTFDFVMVVPAYGEAASFVDGYRSAVRQGGRVLLVVVLNGRAGADVSIDAANADCFRQLGATFSLREVGPGGWLGQDGDLSLLVVDRFSEGRHLPARHGVGLARKIGADVALELIAAERVGHPVIAMTDADARLPDDYFARLATLDSSCSAAVFPFWHEPGGQPDIDRATALYEIRLRYIQRGLRWARSPYAFHSVGSTMAVQALSYALVRGVPRRRAGEDFYLLGKLSKLGPLAYLGGAPVRLRSRLSERVPFGTGAESARLARGAAAELYHPDCFAAVQEVTDGLRRLAGDHGESGSAGAERAVSARCSAFSLEVRRFLEMHGAPTAWQGICAQAPDAASRLARLHGWFDGFRTLKLMHHVRDHTSPSVPWKEAIRQAPFMDRVDDDGAWLTAARSELLRLEQGVARPTNRVPPSCDVRT